MLTAAPAIAAPQFAKPPPATTVTAPVEHVAEGVADRDTVRAKLLANRRANLERFRTYQARGEFPSNTYTDGLENVWIDADGHLCAAATIIKASGSGALVAQVGRDNNFIRLADVRDGALMDWMLTSGLTQEELVAIQRPFQGVGAGKPMVGRPVTVDPD
ncbi:MAG: hypothetical protein ABI867_11475, partial [Kofleriaceae bacterium]